MRYIGSKVNLLDDINTFLEENIGYIGEDGVFCDIFSGTASVARYFKPKFEIISTCTVEIIITSHKGSDCGIINIRLLCDYFSRLLFCYLRNCYYLCGLKQ